MKNDADALDKAQLIADYHGPVYYEGLRGSYGDGYFENVEELAERLDDEDDQSSRPEFAFCCSENRFSIDIDNVIQSALEEMDEDAGDRLDGEQELATAVSVFNKLNEGVISWYEDREHKVAIPPMTARAEHAPEKRSTESTQKELTGGKE